MAGIDILSINVHGLRDPVKCSNVVDWLKTRKESIVFLQETYFSEPDDTDFLKSIWKGPTFSSFGGKHSRGVTTLIKESLSAKTPRANHDNCGRWVNVILDTNDSTLQLLNIYAPCPIGERSAFFQTLPPHIRGGVPTIIGGDFNCISNLFTSYHQFIPFSNRASAREAESQVEFLFNDSRVVFFVSWVMHRLVHE